MQKDLEQIKIMIQDVHSKLGKKWSFLYKSLLSIIYYKISYFKILA
jgi:hypothetical protein